MDDLNAWSQSMADVTDAASVIEDTLDTIAEDEVASLVGDVLRAAWIGQQFDEQALRARFAVLALEEEA
jgi:hypothetical protein